MGGLEEGINVLAGSAAGSAVRGSQQWSSTSGMYAFLSSLARSPIMPVSLLLAAICTLFGYLAFLVLQAQEEAAAEEGVSDGRKSSSTKEPKAVHVADEATEAEPEGQPREQEDARNLTPAPDTPNASTQTLPKVTLDSEDGNSSIQIERLSSGVPGGPPSEAVLKSTGVSFRVLGSTDSERGPLSAEVPDGERNYVWDDDSEYFGTWRGGYAHGRGVFSWPSGDRYEGEWENGRENGVGTYIAADGSTFYGFWSDGKMHGEGVYKPAAAENQRAEVMFMREYNTGKLVKETVLRVKDYDYHRKELKRDQRARKTEKRQAAKELAAPRPGETIYKGHRSYDLMRNLQMGILFSIAKTNREVSDREVEPRLDDYKTEVTQQFPRSGQSTSFKWKDYCPLVFHRLREAFGIDNRDYLLSLTGDKALRELPSPGKSGSVFFISDDDRFMIKTVRKEEMRLLLELVPTYYKHCLNNPDTLLTRFYGVHRVKPIYGHHVRFLVMGNVFPTETRLHRKFDLKGSTFGRTAGIKALDPNATLKDLDVDFRLQLKDAYYKQLMCQIESDATLLERMHVMDYSLLLGIHYVDWDDSRYVGGGETPSKKGETSGGDDSAAESEGNKRQRSNWDEEHASAEHDANKFSPQNQIFNKFHSQKGLQLDEPSPVPGSSEGEGKDDANRVPRATTPSTTELEPPSPASSLTSASIATHSGTSPYRKIGSVEDLHGQLKDGVGITAPAGSWPALSPSRPSRFAVEKRTHPGPQPHASPFSDSRTPCPAACDPAKLPQGTRVDNGSEIRGASRGEPRGAEGQDRLGTQFSTKPSGDLIDCREPRFLQLLDRVRIREERPSMDKSALDRTRSGWLKDQAEGTSLRSLHSEARQHMGVSIPALAFPQRSDGSADTDAKPQPVTLFFGIIDFLQDYNMRKRTEHMLKSILQDGKTISVTSPHTYSQRFIRHMQTLFIPVPSSFSRSDQRNLN